MERTAKLESLGVLAAGIAHDFNNLLGGLFGHLDLARAQLDTASAARSHLDLAHQAFERARALTGQLLAFAKGGAPVRKLGSLAVSVKQCAEFALSGSNVKCELELSEDLWNAEYDENQLAQAFDNILINAKQAMPSGGTLRIVGRNVTANSGAGTGARARALREAQLRRSADRAFLPRFCQRIFDPFFTTKSEGSGVGLTATYAILKKHDGHIEAESRPGAGATFHVWLPAVTERARSARPAPRDIKKGRGLVLVMDDDDIVRHVAGSMLTHLGYEPIPTCDGVEALERTQRVAGRGQAAQRGHAGPHRPLRRRVDATRWTPCEQLVPELPIIASSGYSDDPVMADPTQFGFTASLHKPFRLTDLGDLLARLVASASK